MNDRAAARSAPTAGDPWDLLVIGSGPAGSTAARRAALGGLRVLVLEQDHLPRFHIGESFLPRNLALIRELGLEQELRGIPRTVKLGGSFAMGDETDFRHFSFGHGLLDADPECFNIERAPFDRLLLDAARRAGARVDEGVTVRRIERLADGDVALVARGPEGEESLHRARWLIDASGQGTVVGRHLGTRRTLPDLERVAYYEHFQNVERSEGVRAGFPVIVMVREGWFWLIPLDAERTSIGVVMDARATRQIEVPPRQRLAWAIERCPIVKWRTRNAVFPEENRVTADFSYTCRPYAGPGYFMAGDAATFVDPIFSTGVCMSMMSAVRAADFVRDLLAGRASAPRVRREYDRYVEGSSAVFFRIVRGYYDHAFRELFLHGKGPVGVHRAVISALSGHVFPRPPLAVRWRLRLFELIIRLHKVRPLVPARRNFSLLEPAA